MFLMSEVPLYHTVENAAFVASKFRALLDQICTTYGPELSRVIHVDRLLMKGSYSTVWTLPGFRPGTNAARFLQVL